MCVCVCVCEHIHACVYLYIPRSRASMCDVASGVGVSPTAFHVGADHCNLDISNIYLSIYRSIPMYRSIDIYIYLGPAVRCARVASGIGVSPTAFQLGADH